MLGGIVSIVSGIIFSLIALYILYQTRARDNIKMTEDIGDVTQLNYTVGDYFN